MMVEQMVESLACQASIMPKGDLQRSGLLDGLEVLVVDDEIDIRELLAEYLQDQGLIVTTAPDGQAAVAALERSNGCFSLVLTDINMPGEDGFAVLRAALKANADAEVVVITGYGSRDSIRQAVTLGARSYLAKPFKLGQLDTILHGIGERLALEPRRKRKKRAGAALSL